jgi:hypothetical protein
MSHRPEYDDVPAVPADAVPDEHVAALLSSPTAVPAAYLPAAMSGPVAPWRRWAAVVLLTLLVTVTAGGICLTYGPEELFR